jgi:hypothetical protein
MMGDFGKEGLVEWGGGGGQVGRYVGHCSIPPVFASAFGDDDPLPPPFHCLHSIPVVGDAVVLDPAANNTALAHFLPCPDLYCCEGKASPSNPWPCDSVSSCARNRTGVLCGHCQPGMTEVFGSPTCVPLRECTHMEVGIHRRVVAGFTSCFVLCAPHVESTGITDWGFQLRICL